MTAENIADTRGETKKSIIELFPQFVLAATGVIYATGFLVVLSFLDRFGLREAGADFWKARYMHIGILCLAFPLILNGTILSLVHLILHGKFQQTTMWQRLLPVGLLVINLEIVCFILMMLSNRTPAGAIAGLGPIRWILAVTLLGVPICLLVERILEKIAGRDPQNDAELSPLAQSFSVISRWLTFALVIALDVWYFLDYRDTVSGVQPALALTYIGFSILLGAMVSTFIVYERRQVTEDRRRAITILFASMIGPLFYLVVLAFSYGVYQNIPSTRGGGDYTLAPKVTLRVTATPGASAPEARYFDPSKPAVTIPLILIEETSWAFYLADPIDAGGPPEWKQIGGRKPQIFILNKSEVLSLVSESRNPKQTVP